MSNSPLVSVVIPTYNQATFVVEALESVFAQTFKDYEVIVVDDGSTDETVQRLKQFTDRIQLLKQIKNSGSPGIARNRGIEAAQGKYIATLDHDDLWLPQKLERQVAFMENHPECVACVVPWSISDRSNQPVFNPDTVCDDKRFIKRPIRNQYQTWFWTTSAQLIRRDAIDGIRYGTELDISCEDREFQIQLFARGPVGVAGNKPLAIYRVHSDNFSRKQPLRGFRGSKYLRDIYIQGKFTNLNFNQQQDLLFFLAMRSRSVLIRLLKTGFKKEAWELYRKELPWLLSSQHFPFALVFPIILIMPKIIANNIWPYEQ